jgi:hypothetical protein
MVVVAHDHIRVELPTTALGRLEDASLKGLRRFFVGEEVLTVIPPAYDVVNGSRI